MKTPNTNVNKRSEPVLFKNQSHMVAIATRIESSTE
jgi:hypothetical protein